MRGADRERLFVELYDQNRARLLRLCAGYLGSAADADDLFQDVMINVWNGLPAFRRESSASTWIYRIAVNTALMYRRAASRRAKVITTPVDALPDRAAPPEAGDNEQRLAQLHRAIAWLAPQDRICITLTLEGLSYKEIAEVTGMTVNHVGVRISRAKRALESSMKEHDGGTL